MHPQDPAEPSANPRHELHTLIETLPDAVLTALRDVLLRAHHERTLPAVVLVVETLHGLC